MEDFIFDLLKSESCDYTNTFIEQLFTSSSFPLTTKPTIKNYCSHIKSHRQHFY